MSYCRACGAEILETAVKCKACGREVEVSADKNLEPTTKSRLNGGITIAIAVIAGLFLGNFHILTGSKIGLRITLRESFGFSEIFVNANEITGMPFLAAMIKYPLGTQVLQREGYIETPEEFQKRLNEDLMKDVSESMEVFDEAVKQLLEGSATAGADGKDEAQDEVEDAVEDGEGRPDVKEIQAAVSTHKIASQFTMASQTRSLPTSWKGVPLIEASAQELERNQVWWYHGDAFQSVIELNIYLRNRSLASIGGIIFELDATTCPNTPGDGKLFVLPLARALTDEQDVVLTAKVTMPRDHPAFQGVELCGTVVAVW